MRILTRSEMDGLFGGQTNGTVTTTTTDTVHVTGLRVSQGDYYVTSDFGGGFAAYNEYSSGYSGGSYSPFYPAIPPAQLPSANKLRCMYNAAASAAGLDTLGSGWDLTIVNSWGYQSLTSGSNGYNDIALSRWRSSMAGFQEIRGLAAPTDWNATTGTWVGGTATIYAAAFEAMTSGFRSNAYYLNGVLQTNGTPIGAVDSWTHAVFVMGHEVRHAWQFANPNTSTWYGGNKEADAETFALKVLDSWRAGNTGNCQ